MRTNPLLVSAVILVLLPFASASGAEANELNINCTIHSSYEAFFFRLVEEICVRNNIKVIRQTPPVGRSLIRVNQGIDDGDGPRIGGLSSSFSNLVQVPEPFGDFVFGAFTENRDIRIDGWESLSDLNVAYIIGWKIFDQKVRHAKSITRVSNMTLLFGLLEKGRTDVVLITKLPGYEMIEKLNLEGVRFVEPPLAVEPNFLYLNKRYEALAPVLAETLREIKKDGTYQRLYDEMILPHLPK